MANRTFSLLLIAMTALACISALVSILIGAGVVYNGHMRALYGDEWTNITFYFDRGLMDSIFYRHHAHPLILPNVIFRLDYLLLDASGKARSIFTACTSFLVAMGIVRLLLYGYSGYRRTERKTAIGIAVVILAMGLWMGMGVKLIWIFGITDHFVALGTLIAAFGFIRLHRSQNEVSVIGFAMLILGSVIATFSFGTGLTLWIAFSIILWVSGMPARLISIYVSVGVVAVYLAMFVIPGFGNTTPPVSLPSLALMLDWSRVIITIVGNVFVNVIQQTGLYRFGDNAFLIAQIIGFVAIILLTWLVLKYRKSLKNDAPGLGLLAIILVSLGGAGLVAISRLGTWGIEVGLTPRYAPMSILFWMSAFGLLQRISMLRNESQRAGATSLLVISVLSCGMALFIAYTNIKYVPLFMKVGMNTSIGGLAVMVDPTKSNSNIKKYYAHTDTTLKVAELLRLNDKDFFKEAIDDYLDQPLSNILDEYSAVVKCRAEFIHVPYYDQPNSILLQGWASKNGTSSLKEILVVNEGRVVGVGTNAPILRSQWRNTRVSSENEALQWLNANYSSIALAFGIPNGGWVATARLSSEDLSEAHIIALIDDGSYCYIKQ